MSAESFNEKFIQHYFFPVIDTYAIPPHPQCGEERGQKCPLKLDLKLSHSGWRETVGTGKFDTALSSQ